ncbi:glyoxalase [Dankookia rubra]|uniref:Glyoxalase n=1 Tax=Dankookia rubra TaxID=1442381 RepID=A0A4V3A9I7_9PROT|nr:VOC family protein [Dankookia rubra]TDH59465.1 glyoxalase [Dankookia rubra]
MASRDAGPILGLDHITLVVEALDEAVAAYETLFAQGCGGRGAAEGLDWARFGLANTALVLVAPRGEAGAVARHVAHRPDGAPAALGALAFATAAPDGAARLMERRGLPAAGPALPWLGRQATPLLPDAARGLHLLLTPPGPATASATRLDHAVIRSGDPERTIALLAGRLGLELRLDRSNPAWGQRLLFFRCGELVVEVSHELAGGITDAPDSLWGLTWRVADVGATHARLAAAGVPVSPLRVGRKPGTRLFTIRDHAAAVPTAFIGA